MPKTLLVDTNRAAVPLYQALIRKGHDVWVVGKNPEETLAKMAENFVELDYSDAAALSHFIDQEQFDCLVPGCTDLSYMMCAKVSAGKFCGIDSVVTTNKINSKDEFKKLADKLSISVPGLISEAAAVGHPSVIVKPVDSFSGQGIQVLNLPSEQQLSAAVGAACKVSKSETAIIEEYVAGQLFSYSCFLQAGRVVSGFFVQEDGSANPFTVDTSQVINNLREPLKAALKEDVHKIADELEIFDGLFHLQFLSDGENYWVIEMTRRCPGDIYALLIEYATGYDYSGSYIAPFIGESLTAQHGGATIRNIIRHTVVSDKGQAFWGLQFDQAVKVILSVPLASSGVVARPNDRLRLGVLFIEAESQEEQAMLYQKLVSRNLYRLGYGGETNE